MKPLNNPDIEELLITTSEQFIRLKRAADPENTLTDEHARMGFKARMAHLKIIQEKLQFQHSQNAKSDMPDGSIEELKDSIE